MTFVKEKCDLKKTISELHNIGFKFQTDKCWIQPDGLSYLVHYDKFMSKKKYSKINFLEVGVRDGASLKTWHKYFVNHENIVGLDIDEHCEQFKDHKSISVIVSDATKPINDEKLLIGFDFILDDGSHFASDIIDTFNLLFHKLNKNGFYIVEDLDTVERISSPNEFSDLMKLINEHEAIFYPSTCIIRKT